MSESEWSWVKVPCVLCVQVRGRSSIVPLRLRVCLLWFPTLCLWTKEVCSISHIIRNDHLDQKELRHIRPNWFHCFYSSALNCSKCHSFKGSVLSFVLVVQWNPFLSVYCVQRRVKKSGPCAASPVSYKLVPVTVNSEVVLMHRRLMLFLSLLGVWSSTLILKVEEYVFKLPVL